MLSIIIPANNEEGYIGACLDALLDQTDVAAPVEIIVAANACTDRTVAIVREREAAFSALGWELTVLDLDEPGKINALNRADEIAGGGRRLYLDADVTCSPSLVSDLLRAIDGTAPVYASGRLQVAPADSWVTRRYAALWTRLPFMTETVPGAGLFAVNGAGRAKWGAFPDVIADDAYVRLLFTPEERVAVPAPYLWPMVEGFWTLVKVRLRQDDGARQIAARYPELMRNEDKPPVSPSLHLRLIGTAPVSYAVYLSVALAVRVKRMLGGGGSWTRGR